ncbi:MAG: hypothetical protein IPN77_32115 [Sandaracinaceae bacterium]|nr:hypothetical protein [Sandaracinaceae bacterium]
MMGRATQAFRPTRSDAVAACPLGLASRWGVAARHERRGLNKSVVEGGCPFNRALPEGARTLAVGVNDSGARIHGLNESLPGWTFPLHAAELDVIFRWVGRAARSAA